MEMMQDGRMTHTISIHTRSNPSRRRILLTGCAAAIAAAFPAAARTEAASALVERVVGEIDAVLESGRSRDQMAREIEQIIATYTDLATIARSALGPAARTASAEQLRAYENAFQGYLARKYTQRFDEFFGGSVILEGVEPWKSHLQAHARAEFPDRAAISVIFRISDRSGRPLIFDIIISGVSLLKTEALEIRGLLDRSRGDLDRLTLSLQSIP